MFDEFEEFWELYDEMEKRSLIPIMGDSSYFYPAMVLRVSRLLYERYNNGNWNYEVEEEDGFYHEMESVLDEFGRKYGFGNLGFLVLFGDEEKLKSVIERFVSFIKEREGSGIRLNGLRRIRILLSKNFIKDVG